MRITPASYPRGMNPSRPAYLHGIWDICDDGGEGAGGTAQWDSGTVGQETCDDGGEAAGGTAQWDSVAVGQWD
eukprot:581354-Pyramimonas_sp.AAC.1